MLYHEKPLSPMLIGKEAAAFDDKNYIYELKLDGVRCLLYIEEGYCELRNKRGLKLNSKFPELKELYKQIKAPCILDGELYIFNNGEPDFYQVQKRTIMSDPFKIRLHAKEYPASYTAFDILYYKDNLLLQEPLIDRKQQLASVVKESQHLTISRYVEEKGMALFELTTEKGLEGIVAKRKDSKYYCEKRTKDWIKCKNLLDDDFIIVGYIQKEKGIVSLVLAQYDKQKHLVYKGHVSMGVSLSYLQIHSKKTHTIPSFIKLPSGNKNAIWITPALVGTVKFMEYTANGGLRQPIFKGFREDKQISECIVRK